MCVPCVLFERDVARQGGHQPQPHQQLVTCVFRNLKKGVGYLSGHGLTQTHKYCVERAVNCLERINDPTKDIQSRLNEQRTTTISANRRKLTSVLKTVIFLGKNNLPFRGHRDSGTIQCVNNDPAVEYDHEGVFRSVVCFRIDAGDAELKQLVEDSPLYVSYMSPRIQNELKNNFL